jgi:hypothetical protein
VKSVDDVVDSIRKQLDSRWDAELIDPSWWPRPYTLGAPASGVAATMTLEVRRWAFDWHDYVKARGGSAQGLDLDVPTTRRNIGGRAEQLPTHLRVRDLDAAAHVAGSPWPGRLRIARSRLAVLRAEFPDTVSAKALRLAQPLADVDFDLARVAARWFAGHDPAEWEQLTPRQVPVEGLHGKWLNGHRPLVQTLAGLDSISLRQRPTRIYFTYLDPEYRRSNRRLHDSHTLHDQLDLPYRPRTVVIAENKDTAFQFPELAGAIAVEGNGNASVGLLPKISWIVGADQVVYWGDLDPKGYEIVNGLRAHGLAVRTILMDRLTYETYERFGTNTETNGKPVPHQRKDLDQLTDAEREVYLNLTDPAWTRHRRVEQERIPLDVAFTQVLR